MPRKNSIRRKIGEVVAEICEVPAETVCRIPVFVLRGRHELEITGCTGVLEYSHEKIVLSAGKEKLTVIGRQLELCDLYESVLYICGSIRSLEYGSEEGEQC